MRLIRLLCAITCCWSLLVVQALAQGIESKQSIVIATEEWPGYTNSNSDGIYQEVIRAVYPEDQFDVQFEFVSFADSITMHKRQLADIVLGAYVNDIKGALYPNTHLDIDVVVALHNKAFSDVSMENLAASRIGWMRSYNYDDYFTIRDTFVELDDRETALVLLSANKLDVFIDFQSEVKNLLAKTGTSPRLTTSKIGYMKTFPVFQNSEKGQQLATLWESKMGELISNNKFRSQYEAIGTRLYPYDKKVLARLPNQ